MEIKAVIFDMDGLLIDSEPIWRMAEVRIFNELGVPLTEEMTFTTVGLRLDEVVSYWYDRHPWTGPGRSEVEEMIIKAVADLHRSQCRLMPGVKSTLDFLKQQDIPLAVASSSHPLLISTALDSTGITGYFNVIQSGYQEYYSKPNPEIFLTVAAKLAVPPHHCLVFEDSYNGMIAGLAARMKVIAVPEQHTIADPRFVCADHTLRSLEDFTPELWAALNT